MADNTTTYNAVIDVETKGVTDVDILSRSISTSIGEFENLTQAIGETEDALGKLDPVKDAKKFKVLQKEIKELRDRQEDVEIASRRFTEALAEQPGIIGLVGGSLDGLRGTIKVFMANPIIAVVTLLAGAFLTLRESLTKTTEGQETLNRISAAFGKILGPVFAVIEKVALPIFEGFALVLEKVASGFNRFAKFLGISQEKIEEASINSSEVLQKAKEEEDARQEEQTKKLEEETQKRIEAQKREAEERKRLQEEAGKILRDSELALMDDRNRELAKREEEYQNELKVLKAAGVEDLTIFEEEYRQSILDINKKYDDAEIQAEKDKQDKIKAEKEKEKADEEARIQTQKELESQRRQDELNFLQADFNLRQTLGALKFEEELAFFDKQKELQRQELVANEATNKQLIAFDKETAAARTQIEVAQQQAKLAVISDALGTLAQAVGENTAAGKALAVAQAIINTYQGATLALATYPPPFGAIAAATVIAAGFLQVKKIVSTKVPKPPGTNLKGGSASSGAGGASASITPPQIQTAAAAQGNTGTQIAQTIAESTSKPVQAYVVSTEVSSTQALDRRTNSAASFG